MKKILLLLFILSILSSCRTTGYGCKGTSSWNQMVQKANRLY